MHPYNKTYQYLYIDTQSALESLCRHYTSVNVLAIDTEFVRTETLTPLLGLIQVFDKNQVALIDPVAIEDLSCFADILSNPNIIKVAHSCSEDLEAIWHHMHVLPTSLFDTQFAAGVLDLGVSVGYANLVEQLFKVSVDKGESRTDWIQRPLSDAQCAYASADVTHLMAIYEELKPKVDEQQKTSWVFDEITQLGDKKASVFPAHLAYFNLKNNWKLAGQQLAALQLIAQWRLQEARQQNKSVNFVIKEAAIFELATKLPETHQSLFECHQLYSRQARLYGDQIITLCHSAKSMQVQEYPPRVQRLVEFTGYKQCLSQMKDIVDSMAVQLDVPVTVLASKKQLNQFLKWCWFDFDELEQQGFKPDLISGWRLDLFAPYVAQNSKLRNLIAEQHEIKRSI